MRFKINKVICFDLLLLYVFLVCLTGANVLIPGPLSEYFKAHSRSQRSFVDLMAVFGIFAVLWLYSRGWWEESLIAKLLRRIKLSFLMWTVVVFGILVCTYLFGSLFRHNTFQSAFDLAIFAQAVWNTWQGSFLYSSIKGGICLMGDHVSPFLALLAPGFGIWSDARVLLIMQAIVTASSVFPIYLIGKEVLGDKRLAFVFVIAFALYAPTRNAVRFDFHPEVMGDSLMLWAFYFLLKNRIIWSIIFLALTLSTKEIACGPVAMFGLYACCFQQKRFFGISVFLLAIAYFGLCVFIIAPYFSGAPYFYGANYTIWQERGLEAFGHQIFQLSTLNYFKKIFLPLGCLSVFSPSTLVLTIPVLVQNLTAASELARSTFFQYSSLLTWAVFISAIFGLRNVAHWLNDFRPRWQRHFPIVVSLLVIGWSFLLSGKSDYQIIKQYVRDDKPHFSYLRKYLTTIPRSLAVRTNEFLAPHLATRKELYIYENTHPKEGGSEKAQRAACVILDQMFLKQPAETAVKELETRGYSIQHEHEGFYVLMRDTNG